MMMMMMMIMIIIILRRGIQGTSYTSFFCCFIFFQLYTENSFFPLTDWTSLIIKTARVATLSISV